MKILIVYGTRPELIKLAPVIYALKDNHVLRIMSTGQHMELVQQVLDFFRIRPDFSFDCMTGIPDLPHLYECIVNKARLIIEKEAPDLIMVQGDTLTTYAVAFVGFLTKKPVFHIEAGLRTHNMFSPFPEEGIRRGVSCFAEMHFAPTQTACANLLAEGFRRNRILITGNTVVDAVALAERLIDENEVLQELLKCRLHKEQLESKDGFALITVHRRENIGEPLRQICRAIMHLSQHYKNMTFIWPVHLNPEVRDIVFEEIGNDYSNIILTNPLSYQTMLYLMKRVRILLTDSGGIQEEAPLFGKPLLILRDTTERPEIIETNYGVLTGANQENIIKEFARFYQANYLSQSTTGKYSLFGDGNASERIAKFLLLDEVTEFIASYPSSSKNFFDTMQHTMEWIG